MADRACCSGVGIAIHQCNRRHSCSQAGVASGVLEGASYRAGGCKDGAGHREALVEEGQYLQ